ncbi:collagen alpha-2(I) chain-like [Ammospiza caudacuta]|uniref:collagen alpha-2(I) chain-like n=1 Tax=Ammospiza caudacuta TaxID=2857398 RepID=UPI0027385225|nr:collagen alpha-2(I) chain-like [Ammospiza caudacuta]
MGTAGVAVELQGHGHGDLGVASELWGHGHGNLGVATKLRPLGTRPRPPRGSGSWGHGHGHLGALALGDTATSGLSLLGTRPRPPRGCGSWGHGRGDLGAVTWECLWGGHGATDTVGTPRGGPGGSWMDLEPVQALVGTSWMEPGAPGVDLGWTQDVLHGPRSPGWSFCGVQERPGWTRDVLDGPGTSRRIWGNSGLNLGPAGVTWLDLVGIQVTMGTPGWSQGHLDAPGAVLWHPGDILDGPLGTGPGFHSWGHPGGTFWGGSLGTGTSGDGRGGPRWPRALLRGPGGHRGWLRSTWGWPGPCGDILGHPEPYGGTRGQSGGGLRGGGGVPSPLPVSPAPPPRAGPAPQGCLRPSPRTQEGPGGGGGGVGEGRGWGLPSPPPISVLL